MSSEQKKLDGLITKMYNIIINIFGGFHFAIHSILVKFDFLHSQGTHILHIYAGMYILDPENSDHEKYT